MDFSATRISTQDFTSEQIRSILADARQQIAEERTQTQSESSFSIEFSIGILPFRSLE